VHRNCPECTDCDGHALYWLVHRLQSRQTAVSAALTIPGYPTIFAPVDLTSAHGLPGAAEVAVPRA
jgi:hypothetical protein